MGLLASLLPHVRELTCKLVCDVAALLAGLAGLEALRKLVLQMPLDQGPSALAGNWRQVDLSGCKELRDVAITVDYGDADELVAKPGACPELQGLSICCTRQPGFLDGSCVSRAALQALAGGPAGQSLQSVRLHMAAEQRMTVAGAAWLCSQLGSACSVSAEVSLRPQLHDRLDRASRSEAWEQLEYGLGVAPWQEQAQQGFTGEMAVEMVRLVAGEVVREMEAQGLAVARLCQSEAGAGPYECRTAVTMQTGQRVLRCRVYIFRWAGGRQVDWCRCCRA